MKKAATKKFVKVAVRSKSEGTRAKATNGSNMNC